MPRVPRTRPATIDFGRDFATSATSKEKTLSSNGDPVRETPIASARSRPS